MSDDRRSSMWNWAWITAVLVILTSGFVTYDSTRWGSFVLLGAGLFALLAILPTRKRPGEAWICVAVIVSCGLLGAYRFSTDFATIHPRDRSDFLRLYIGFGIVTGIAIVLPYVVIRLLTGQLKKEPIEREGTQLNDSRLL